MKPSEAGGHPTIYAALSPDRTYPLTLAVRLRGTTPDEFASRLRAIGAAIDPSVQLREIASLDTLLRQEQQLLRLFAIGLGAITACVVVLSAAGIYALMSFTVSRRRKEIGIRAALGADPARILGSIFSRAALQLGLGAAAGILIAAALEAATEQSLMNGHGAVVLPMVAVMMTVVGLAAAYVPARRGLSVQPTEALREQ